MEPTDPRETPKTLTHRDEESPSSAPVDGGRRAHAARRVLAYVCGGAFVALCLLVGLLSGEHLGTEVGLAVVLATIVAIFVWAWAASFRSVAKENPESATEPQGALRSIFRLLTALIGLVFGSIAFPGVGTLIGAFTGYWVAGLYLKWMDRVARRVSCGRGWTALRAAVLASYGAFCGAICGFISGALSSIVSYRIDLGVLMGITAGALHGLLWSPLAWRNLRTAAQDGQGTDVKRRITRMPYILASLVGFFMLPVATVLLARHTSPLAIPARGGANGAEALAGAVLTYAQEHGGELPDSLGEVLPYADGNVEVFFDPLSEEQDDEALRFVRQMASEGPERLDQDSDYVLYVRGNLEEFTDPGEIVLLYGRRASKKRLLHDYHPVAFADGSGRFVRTRKLAELMRQTDHAAGMGSSAARD